MSAAACRTFTGVGWARTQTFEKLSVIPDRPNSRRSKKIVGIKEGRISRRTSSSSSTPPQRTPPTMGDHYSQETQVARGTPKTPRVDGGNGLSFSTPNINPNFGQARQQLLYCGKRLLDPAYLPTTDEGFSRLYDHNKYPLIPYSPEIAAVIEELEDQIADEQEEEERRALSSQSPTPGGTPTPTPTPRGSRNKKRKIVRFPTIEQIYNACEERGVNIEDYIIPNMKKLTPEHMELVKAFCRNRMTIAFQWTEAFKNAIVRDALGIDKDHLAFSIAFDTCTDTRSHTQSKILGKAHGYAVQFNTSDTGLKHYTLKHVGKQPTYDDVPGGPGAPGAAKAGKARLPNTAHFPESYQSIEVAMDVFSDIADAVDWNACYKGGKKQKGVNHLGRAIILKSVTCIQAECLNALQNNWTNRQGVYARPINAKGRKDNFKRHDAVLKTVRATDITCAPIIHDPVEIKRREAMVKAGQGALVKQLKEADRVVCLYPLPKYLKGSKKHRKVVEMANEFAENEALLLFGEASLSELEDNGEEEEEEVDEEFPDEEA
ncbi:hypothetical protein BJ508DRAFT_333647 [Ascobolus immersus RN42]|uniref:Uncharacterized protein n=1 Tax=Ascobolus immersus RN42 TaxID=1160509 RepID=A0A3N4HKU0_ASCIM|nr:hypothetical protein BJ508DRAFT_333647 [Ascobolus immersus RN42]